MRRPVIKEKIKHETPSLFISKYEQRLMVNMKAVMTLIIDSDVE